MATRWRRIGLVGIFVVGVLIAVAIGALRLRPSAAADAIWANGDEESVRKMFRAELDRIPESDGPARARVFIRFGIIDSNPDGQAALFAQACVADPKVCDRDRLKKAAEREVRARKVPPGDTLPLYFIGHHPAVDSGTLGGFPNPPAPVRGEQSSPAPHAPAGPR
jgi:hypothetical protein